MIKTNAEIVAWLKNLQAQLETVLEEQEPRVERKVEGLIGEIKSKTNLPVPPGWKPSSKLEALTWLANLETQIGAVLTEEDSQLNAKLYVALAIVGRVEQIINDPANTSLK